MQASDKYKFRQKNELSNLDPKNVYSIAHISRNIREILDAHPQLTNVILKGEITNFAKATSGHIYFSLKDEYSSVACAFFEDFQDAHENLALEDGLQILAMGSVTTYEPRSQYQINVKQIIPLGNGPYFSQIESLRKKLDGDGLFGESRKKPIPHLPRKVGIVTSRDSTAIADIMNVIASRFPKMNLVRAFAAVQGEAAPQGIIRSINLLSGLEDVDTIILARGGGPKEDLAPFNDECLVRSISETRKPIVTGIGHEKDTTLADLAADFRASTPSTAAKAAVPDMEDLLQELDSLSSKLNRSYDSYVRMLDLHKEKADNQIELESRDKAIYIYKIVIFILLIMVVLLAIVMLRFVI